MRKSRSRKLSREIALKIAEVISELGPPITWARVMKESADKTRLRYRRQTLSRNPIIRHAYMLKKKAGLLGTKGKGRCRKCGELSCKDRAQSLASQLSELRAENQELLQKFVVWSYNAHLQGISEEGLNRPIPMVDRK